MSECAIAETLLESPLRQPYSGLRLELPPSLAHIDAPYHVDALVALARRRNERRHPVHDETRVYAHSDDRDASLFGHGVEPCGETLRGTRRIRELFTGCHHIDAPRRD